MVRSLLGLQGRGREHRGGAAWAGRRAECVKRCSALRGKAWAPADQPCLSHCQRSRVIESQGFLGWPSTQRNGINITAHIRLTLGRTTVAVPSCTSAACTLCRGAAAAAASPLATARRGRQRRACSGRGCTNARRPCVEPGRSIMIAQKLIQVNGGSGRRGTLITSFASWRPCCPCCCCFAVLFVLRLCCITQSHSRLRRTSDER